MDFEQESNIQTQNLFAGFTKSSSIPHRQIKKPPLMPIPNKNNSVLGFKIKIEKNLGFSDKNIKEGFSSNHSTENSFELIKNGMDFGNFEFSKKQLIEKMKRKKEEVNFEDFFESPVAIRKEEEKNIKIFETNYEKIEILGKGHFSIVYKVKHKLDGQIYAIKLTKSTIKTVKTRSQILNEVQILAAMSVLDNNYNIIRYYNSWIENKELYIQIEYCEKSLSEMMKTKTKWTQNELEKILKDVCNGLISLHKNKIVHLDIKPDNILFSEKHKRFKIADFGLARPSQLLKEDDLNEGDSRYLAHELLNISSENIVDLTKADIFSLGASIYELSINEILPQCGNEWQSIRHGNLIKLNQRNDFSKNFKNIIEKMMNFNVKDRPSGLEIMKELEENNILAYNEEKRIRGKSL